MKEFATPEFGVALAAVMLMFVVVGILDEAMQWIFGHRVRRRERVMPTHMFDAEFHMEMIAITWAGAGYDSVASLEWSADKMGLIKLKATSFRGSEPPYFFPVSCEKTFRCYEVRYMHEYVDICKELFDELTKKVSDACHGQRIVHPDQ